MLDDGSLFRKGPECLKMGIEAAVSSNRLVPIDKISPSQVETRSCEITPASDY